MRAGLRVMLICFVSLCAVLGAARGAGTFVTVPILSFAAWHQPDGLYKTDIFVYDWQTSQLINLTPDIDLNLIEYDWSPDGNIMAITNFSEKGMNILLYDVVQQNFAIPPVRGLSASWSDDNQQLVYLRTSVRGSRTDSDIFLLSVGTLAETNLTNTPDTGEIHPMWTRTNDGVLYRAEHEGNSAIYRLGLDGTTTPGMFSPQDAASILSPDQTMLARIVVNPARRLQLITPSGEVLQEVPLENTLGDLLWSPDGTRVAIAPPSPRPANAYGMREVILYDVERNVLQTYLRDDDYRIEDMAWLPDGQLGFIRSPAPDHDPPWELVILDPETTSAQHRLIPRKLKASHMNWQP